MKGGVKQVICKRILQQEEFLYIDSEYLGVLRVNVMLGIAECDWVALFLCLEHDS